MICGYLCQWQFMMDSVCCCLTRISGWHTRWAFLISHLMFKMFKKTKQNKPLFDHTKYFGFQFFLSRVAEGKLSLHLDSTAGRQSWVPFRPCSSVTELALIPVWSDKWLDFYLVCWNLALKVSPKAFPFCFMSASVLVTLFYSSWKM